jgi:thioredoxin reductase (NADPH)
VVVFRTGRVLVDPSHAELSEFLGASTRAEPETYDVAVVGAGPAGLAAAVSAASEGLRTLVVEPEVFGGQAGTSSLIRNYPGFPHGIGGDDLAFRTFGQVFVVGAGNSAGQAAIHLAAHAASVTVLVRGAALGETMSDYLVTKLQATPNISVRLRTEVVDGQAAGAWSG